jgi:hypothetical protein
MSRLCFLTGGNHRITRDGICNGHEGTVQSGRHSPNHTVADEPRKTKGVELAHERRACSPTEANHIIREMSTEG